MSFSFAGPVALRSELVQVKAVLQNAIWTCRGLSGECCLRPLNHIADHGSADDDDEKHGFRRDGADGGMKLVTMWKVMDEDDGDDDDDDGDGGDDGDDDDGDDDDDGILMGMVMVY